MKKLIKITMIPIIIIGAILTAIYILNGFDNSIIAVKEVNYGTFIWKVYTFDTRQFILNLQEGIQNYNITIIFPNFPTTPKLPNWADIPSILKYIANCFIWTPNILIYIIEILLLAPIKFLFYPFETIMVMLGIQNANIWYAQFLKKLLYFNIEYIIYLT